MPMHNGLPVIKREIDEGTRYLAGVLEKAALASGHTIIRVQEEDEEIVFATDADGIMAAALEAREIDGLVGYTVGPYRFVTLFDGPYTKENAEEIINDCNDEAAKLLGIDL